MENQLLITFFVLIQITFWYGSFSLKPLLTERWNVKSVENGVNFKISNVMKYNIWCIQIIYSKTTINFNINMFLDWISFFWNFTFFFYFTDLRTFFHVIDYSCYSNQTKTNKFNYFVYRFCIIIRYEIINRFY